jgi:hypothetical protein
MGLLIAFLLSAVVLPAFSASQILNSNAKLQISGSADAHSTPNTPLPLPEEEKEEEESRSDKGYSFAVLTITLELEKLGTIQNGPTTWEFNHTNTTALSNLPIYLAQHLLLI